MLVMPSDIVTAYFQAFQCCWCYPLTSTQCPVLFVLISGQPITKNVSADVTYSQYLSFGTADFQVLSIFMIVRAAVSAPCQVCQFWGACHFLSFQNFWCLPQEVLQRGVPTKAQIVLPAGGAYHTPIIYTDWCLPYP